MSSYRMAVALAATLGVVVLVPLVVYVFRAPTPAPIVRDTSAIPVPAAPVAPFANDLLAQLDAGAYDTVFDQIAGRFRDGMERSHFVTAMRDIRAPLGQVRERTLKGESAADRDPQGRAGPFRMHQYLTAFDAGPRLEVLVMVAEGDAWRFYSYNVAAAP